MREDLSQKSIEQQVDLALSDFSFNYNDDFPEERRFLFSIVEGPNNEYEIGLADEGGIIEVIGKKGSRKTALMSMFVAACFQENGIYRNIKSRLGDQTILWFDTEMAGSDFFYFQRNLHNMCGLNDNHPRLHAINMDFYESSTQKLEVIAHILKNSNLGEGEAQYFNNIGLVVLDGIADLVGTTEDESEARRILDLIKSILNGLGAVLLTVLHSDKAGRHSRGTLGTLLDQKATSGLMCDMRAMGEVTVVRPDKIRSSRPFSPYELSHDLDGTLLVDGSASDEGDEDEVRTRDFMGGSLDKMD